MHGRGGHLTSLLAQYYAQSRHTRCVGGAELTLIVKWLPFGMRARCPRTGTPPVTAVVVVEVTAATTTLMNIIIINGLRTLSYKYNVTIARVLHHRSTNSNAPRTNGVLPVMSGVGLASIIPTFIV